MTWILDFPMPFGLLFSASVLGAVAVLTFWFLRVFHLEGASPEEKAVAAAAATRIGIFFSLIVSLSFSAVRAEFNDLVETIDSEALALEQLYRGLGAQNTEETELIQQAIAKYTRHVIDDEWPSLQHGVPLFTADELLDKIRIELIILRSDGEDLIVPAALLDDINDAENARGQRSFDTDESVSPLLWAIIAISFGATIICLSATKATIRSTFFIGLFGAVSGALFYGILAYSFPFKTAVGVAPDALETVYMRTMK